MRDDEYSTSSLHRWLILDLCDTRSLLAADCVRELEKATLKSGTTEGHLARTISHIQNPEWAKDAWIVFPLQLELSKLHDQELEPIDWLYDCVKETLVS
jgi:hypothetical protein